MKKDIQRQITTLTNQPFDTAPCKEGDTVRICDGILKTNNTIGQVDKIGRYYSGDVWISVVMGKKAQKFWSDEIAEVIR